MKMYIQEIKQFKCYHEKYLEYQINLAKFG